MVRAPSIVVFCAVLMATAPGTLAQAETEEAAPAPAVEYKLANVVAKVNDHVVTDDQLYQRLVRLNGAQVLGQMISELLVQDAAESRNIEIPAKEFDIRFAEFKGGFPSEEEFGNWMRSQGMSEDDVKAQVRLGMLQERVIVSARDLSVTPEEVTAFFEENKDRLGTPEQLRCSHIVVATQAEADEVLIALQAGADFAKLASLKSQDEATKDTGGDLGFVPLTALAPELQQAIGGLDVGSFSDVVASDAGFHVFKLVEKKPAVPAVLDKKMKDDLARGLLKGKVDAAMPDFMRELHERATISISGITGSP